MEEVLTKLHECEEKFSEQKIRELLKDFFSFFERDARPSNLLHRFFAALASHPLLTPSVLRVMLEDYFSCTEVISANELQDLIRLLEHSASTQSSLKPIENFLRVLAYTRAEVGLLSQVDKDRLRAIRIEVQNFIRLLEGDGVQNSLIWEYVVDKEECKRQKRKGLVGCLVKFLGAEHFSSSEEKSQFFGCVDLDGKTSLQLDLLLDFYTVRDFDTQYRSSYYTARSRAYTKHELLSGKIGVFIYKLERNIKNLDIDFFTQDIGKLIDEVKKYPKFKFLNPFLERDLNRLSEFCVRLQQSRALIPGNLGAQVSKSPETKPAISSKVSEQSPIALIEGANLGILFLAGLRITYFAFQSHLRNDIVCVAWTQFDAHSEIERTIQKWTPAHCFDLYIALSNNQIEIIQFHLRHLLLACPNGAQYFEKSCAKELENKPHNEKVAKLSQLLENVSVFQSTLEFRLNSHNFPKFVPQAPVEFSPLNQTLKRNIHAVREWLGEQVFLIKATSFSEPAGSASAALANDSGDATVTEQPLPHQDNTKVFPLRMRYEMFGTLHVGTGCEYSFIIGHTLKNYLNALEASKKLLNDRHGPVDLLRDLPLDPQDKFSLVKAWGRGRKMLFSWRLISLLYPHGHKQFIHELQFIHPSETTTGELDFFSKLKGEVRQLEAIYDKSLCVLLRNNTQKALAWLDSEIAAKLSSLNSVPTNTTPSTVTGQLSTTAKIDDLPQWLENELALVDPAFNGLIKVEEEQVVASPPSDVQQTEGSFYDFFQALPTAEKKQFQTAYTFFAKSICQQITQNKDACLALCAFLRNEQGVFCFENNLKGTVETFFAKVAGQVFKIQQVPKDWQNWILRDTFRFFNLYVKNHNSKSIYAENAEKRQNYRLQCRDVLLDYDLMCQLSVSYLKAKLNEYHFRVSHLKSLLSECTAQEKPCLFFNYLEHDISVTPLIARFDETGCLYALRQDSMGIASGKCREHFQTERQDTHGRFLVDAGGVETLKREIEKDLPFIILEHKQQQFEREKEPKDRPRRASGEGENDVFPSDDPSPGLRDEERLEDITLIKSLKTYRGKCITQSIPDGETDEKELGLLERGQSRNN